MSLQPRPHQVNALTDLTRALAVHDRTQLVMACGTGKTLVGRWHAEACEAQQVLVLVPSLALVAQTLREWRRATASPSRGWRFSALVVCSDPTTSAGVAERSPDGDGPTELATATWADVQAKVTTNPTTAARFLTQHQPGHPQVVFSTYHSAPVVAAAQATSGAVFDVVIADEAHRLAGRPREEFRVALDPRRIVARKRVFMTATPRAFEGEDGVSMDDPTLFGPVAHTVTFGEAIEAGLLTDYRVMVVAAHEGQPANDTNQNSDLGAVIPAALLDAVDTHQVRRVVSFHSRVAGAKRFAETLTNAATPHGLRVQARHINGTMSNRARMDTLRWLAPADESARGQHGGAHTARVVTNARCLSEGVDVPAVDGILFADPRSSIVDIIQAIGRVLRPAPGKTHGTIILPVALPDGGDDESTLITTAFAHIWAVLRGLRAHDQRLAAEIDQTVRAIAKGQSHRSSGTNRIEFVMPEGIQPAAMHLRLVQELGSRWERNYALLEDWAAANDGRLLPRAAKVGDVYLGEWGEQQRIAYRHGLLPSDRARRLETIPGWAWDKTSARWDLTYDRLRAFVDDHGTIADNPTGPSILAGLKDEERPQRHLGVWLAAQRQAYRLGTLPERRARQLEELPGWAWDAGLPNDDIAMIEALRVFVEFEKHANVPDTHTEDGLPLGAWCWAVRRRKLTDRIAPALEYEILAATPSKFRPAQRFQWENAETQWRLNYFALRQFSKREGHARVTGGHREQLPDATLNLGQWVALQRHQRRRDELDARHAELLAQVPGWEWDINSQSIDASEPVDLPAGCTHGTAGGYRHECRCVKCLEWRRSTDRDRLARKRALNDPVAAQPTRRHLQRLEADGTQRTSMATAAGVPLSVVRRLLAGDVDELEREHERRLLAVTPAQVAQAQDKVGSRGRMKSTHNELIDSAPTWKRLDDLRSRGFGMLWVSRELGYAGSLQIKRGRPVSRRIADVVSDLYDRVGDLTMPRLPRSARRPSLADLRQNHTTPTHTAPTAPTGTAPTGTPDSARVAS